jgi:SAM-dependent methyltransferase
MLYESDLARIHIEGYGFHWKGAAPAVLSWLRQAGIRDGTIVDLGCGGGQWLARLADEGYKTVGVDISPAMLQHARSRVPAAKLICGSFADTELPPCDAVTSLGEPLNYLPGARDVKRTLNHVYRALRPGGLFIFDVRERAANKIEPRVSACEGEDWACIAHIEESSTTGRLVRRITTFRRDGSVYRRGQETHILQLYPRRNVLSWLRQIGFRARSHRGYDTYRLGPRQLVVVARKP